MVRVHNGRRRSLIILLVGTAIAASACSSSTSTASPGGSSPSATLTSAPTSTDQGGNPAGSGLSAAAADLANTRSYKFSMTLAGDPAFSVLSMLDQSSSTGTAPVTYTGTIIVKPDKAADIKVGSLHLIEVGGYDYMEMGGTGGYLRTSVQTPSLVDALSPAQMFSSVVSSSTVSGYDKVGSETKNGVSADHYQANPAALAEYGSILSLGTATLTADIWVASDGGYPVSMAIIAKAADGSLVYEMLFEITSINDPGNKVTAPTDVMGA